MEKWKDKMRTIPKILENEEFATFACISCTLMQDQAEPYVEYLGYCLVHFIQKTLEKTTQLAMTIYFC